MAETGKPGVNWKQVTPANRKKVSPLVRHYMKMAHPFTACVRDNTKRFGPDRAKRICAVVKDMGERTTNWRNGGGKKVTEADFDVDAYIDEVFGQEWAPVLDAEGVTVDELADWAQMAQDAGVLEAVPVDVDEFEAAAGRVLEGAGGEPTHHHKARSHRHDAKPGGRSRAPSSSFSSRMAGQSSSGPAGATSAKLTPAHERKVAAAGADKTHRWSKLVSNSSEGPQKRNAFRTITREVLGIDGDPTEDQVDRVADAWWRGVRRRRTRQSAQISDDDRRVLASVEVPDDVDLDRVVEAAKKAPMSHAKRRPGESLTDYGKRLKAGDATLERDAKKKTRSGKPAKAAGSSSSDGDFEGKHPRGRGGEWTVKAGGKDVRVRERSDGNLESPKDSNAIREFQKKHGLKVDGIIGKQTASALLGNKSARKVATGKLKDDQKARLRPKRGRTREAADGFVLDGDEALAVTFRPSELVAACSTVS